LGIGCEHGGEDGEGRSRGESVEVGVYLVNGRRCLTAKGGMLDLWFEVLGVERGLRWGCRGGSGISFCEGEGDEDLGESRSGGERETHDFDVGLDWQRSNVMVQLLEELISCWLGLLCWNGKRPSKKGAGSFILPLTIQNLYNH
jgi:hypothetical protein